MPDRSEAQRRLRRLFGRTPVVELAALKRALETPSRTTVFRVLSEVGYLTSCSHAGRFYTLVDIPRFDEDGLWFHEGVLFSQHHTLRATLARLVSAAHFIPAGQDGLAVLRGLAQWVLDYGADARHGGFPFVRPYLALYDRCARARRAVDAFLRCPPSDRHVLRVLKRLGRAVEGIVADSSAAQLALTLRKRAQLFDELRDTLRLAAASTVPSFSASPCHETVREVDEIHTDFDRWVAQLRERRPERGPAQDTREAIDIVIAHVDRHGPTLWGHAIALPPEAGGGVRLVHRTNNCQEHFFRGDKHGERRRSGRKLLTHDLETRPAEALLVPNLTHTDYLDIICDGNLDHLPAAFADLDIRNAAAERSAPSQSTKRTAELQPPLLSASLPTADRRILRTDAMDRRIDRAARSRAPRTPVMA